MVTVVGRRLQQKRGSKQQETRQSNPEWTVPSRLSVDRHRCFRSCHWLGGPSRGAGNSRTRISNQPRISAWTLRLQKGLDHQTHSASQPWLLLDFFIISHPIANIRLSTLRHHDALSTRWSLENSFMRMLLFHLTAFTDTRFTAVRFELVWSDCVFPSQPLVANPSYKSG